MGGRRDIRALSSWEMSRVHKDNISLPNNGSGSRRRLAKYKRTTSHCPIMVGTRPGTVGPAALSGGSTSGEGYSGRTTRTRGVQLGWQWDPDNAREPYDALGRSEITTLYVS